MTSCPFSTKLSAYHDGEMPPEERAQFTRHLEGCAACRQDLREMASLTRLLSASPARRLAPGALRRMHDEGLHADEEHAGTGGTGTIRLVKAMTAAAAVVLVISCWHLAHRWSSQGPGGPGSSWEQPAVTNTSSNPGPPTINSDLHHGGVERPSQTQQP